MQALYHSKISNKVGNSKTLRTVSKETFNGFSMNQHFKIRDKSTVPDYKNDKIKNITYSPRESVADIVKKLQGQAILQKYHCMEIAVAVATEI